MAIYLDHAAATPVDTRVLADMLPYFTDNFYNPSAIYLDAKAVKQDIEAARASVASHLGARPSEIIFTAGGTEANNLAIKGVMNKFPDGNLIVSAIEHEAVLKPAKRFNHKLTAVNGRGVVGIEALLAQINDKTVLVSVMYANNEVGSIQPTKDISQKIAQIRSDRLKKGNKLPLYLHTDACQAAAYLDLHISRLGVDLMSLNGGKIYGPKQSGVLYVRAGIDLDPIIDGGGQEHGKRNGTENVPAIIGLASAMKLNDQLRLTEVKRLQEIQKKTIKDLEKAVPNIVINGPRSNRLPNNIHFTIPGADNERMMMELDENGFQVAVGSACQASSEEPSHVLKAMNISDKDANSSLRITMGRSTTQEDMDDFVHTLVKIVS